MRRVEMLEADWLLMMLMMTEEKKRGYGVTTASSYIEKHPDLDIRKGRPSIFDPRMADENSHHD